ncbi:MAG: type II secretion system F family protein [Clostridiales bacterium]|jgi:tight adherence protein C|nr:type II secretion system F family protein [Clostridiales bacterium]
MEWLIAVCAGILIYSVIYILLYKKGAQDDLVRQRLDGIKNMTGRAFQLDEEMNRSFKDRVVRPALKSFAERLAKLMPKSGGGDAAGKNQQAGKLKKMLNQAGLIISPVEYNAIRLVVIAALILLFGLIAIAVRVGTTGVLLSLLLGLYVGYAATRFYLARLITHRQKSIERQLPEVLDLLSVSVEAGLGFEQALNHIITTMKGPLIDELTVTYREMAMGRSRRDALVLLGERCDNNEIKSFAGALVQAGQLGISMKNVLRSQAAAIRQARKVKIQESAQKVSIKILIPMILFIFPVIFIVLLGPAVLNIMANLKLGA